MTATKMRIPALEMVIEAEPSEQGILQAVLETLPDPPTSVCNITLGIGVPFDGMGCVVDFTFTEYDGGYRAEVGMFPIGLYAEECHWRQGVPDYPDDESEKIFEERMTAIERWCNAAAVALVMYCFGKQGREK